MRSGKWQRMPANTFVTSLGEVKDAIGEWHDGGELGGIATELNQHPGCRLLREIRCIAEDKFKQARSCEPHAKSKSGNDCKTRTREVFRKIFIALRAARASFGVCSGCCMNFEVIPCPARAFGTLACRSVSV